MEKAWDRLEVELPRLVVCVYGVLLVTMVLYVTQNKLFYSHMNYYERYAHAISSGHLFIAEGPTAAACPQDAIYFDGKCYLYWGIFPALIHLVLPWVSDHVLSLITSALSLFFYLSILVRLSRGLAGNTRGSLAMMMPTAFFLALCTGLAATAACGWIYGEAICVSLALGLGALYWWRPEIMPLPGRYRASLTRLAGGSALLGAAALSRPPWFLVGTALILWLAYKRRNVRSWAALFLPFTVATLFQLWLNWTRFQNPFEFGLLYMVGVPSDPGPIPRTDVLFSWRYGVLNFVSYFFTALPPYFQRVGEYEFKLAYFSWTDKFYGKLFVELPCALLPSMPSLLLAAWRSPWRKAETRRKLGPLAVCFLPMSILLLFNNSQSWRYEHELWLAPMFLIIPILWARSGKAATWELTVHWASFFFGLGINAINTYWIFRTRLDQL